MANMYVLYRPAPAGLFYFSLSFAHFPRAPSCSRSNFLYGNVAKYPR
jgi:hypothetical protein